MSVFSHYVVATHQENVEIQAFLVDTVFETFNSLFSRKLSNQLWLNFYQTKLIWPGSRR